MKDYQTPEMEKIEYKTEDVLNVSGVDNKTEEDILNLPTVNNQNNP